MTHIWKRSIEIDENKARQLISSQFHLKIETLCLFDEGWDNLVYLVNDTLIFRFPRREFGISCMENEIALLPFLAKKVSFAFSAPQYIGHASASYPYPFAGYVMLQGKPLCDASNALIHDKIFAITLASWLKELHALPITDNHISLLKGDQTWRLNLTHRIARCNENLARYESFFSMAGFSKTLLESVINTLPKLNLNSTKQSYLHGDLYSRHIIVNPSTLMPCGLIDWGDTHIGNPGIDLAVGMIFTQEIYQDFLKAYNETIDDELIHISLFHSFCHSMSFLPYAFEQNKETLKRWATMVLERAINEILNVS
jgi:aminoglycoside phosphotransferase (APT) family kinase protein